MQNALWLLGGTSPKHRTDSLSAAFCNLDAAGIRFGTVLADAGYGNSAPFRQALSEHGLVWAVGISRRSKVCPADVALIFPMSGHGRPRERHVPDKVFVAAEAILETVPWRKVSWPQGTKGRLMARFAAIRVRTADGPNQRIWDMGEACQGPGTAQPFGVAGGGNQHMPRARRSGSLVNTAHRANGSSTYPTCRPTPA